MTAQYWWDKYRTGKYCHYCGCELIEYDTPRNAPFYEDTWYFHGRVWHFSIRQLLPGFGLSTLDHVIPQSKGGANKRDNLVNACLACNLAKCAKDYDRFKPTVKPNPPQFDNGILAALERIEARMKERRAHGET